MLSADSSCTCVAIIVVNVLAVLVWICVGEWSDLTHDPQFNVLNGTVSVYGCDGFESRRSPISFVVIQRDVLITPPPHFPYIL